jgi:hypothetical protein
VLVLVLAIGVLAFATNNSFVLAQPCQAQLGPPNASSQQYYYEANFQVTVPISASCSFYAGQLYATGTAYDTTYYSNVATANTVLTPTYGGYGYTGQLTFTLPTSAQPSSVQFSVSIYGSQNGYYGAPYAGLLAQTSATFVVGPSYYLGYLTYPPYSTPSYPSYSTYPNYPAYPSNHYYNSPRYNQNYGGYYYMGGYYNYYHNSGDYNYNNNNYCISSNRCLHR